MAGSEAATNPLRSYRFWALAGFPDLPPTDEGTTQPGQGVVHAAATEKRGVGVEVKSAGTVARAVTALVTDDEAYYAEFCEALKEEPPRPRPTAPPQLPPMKGYIPVFNELTGEFGPAALTFAPQDMLDGWTPYKSDPLPVATPPAE